MSDLRTLPAIRAEAERLACEVYEAQSKTLYAHGMGPSLLWELLPEQMRVAYVGAHLDLLCDLSRPASRDVVARLVAAKLGWPVGDTAPMLYWTPRHRGPCDHDGAPEGDDWPEGWWLQGTDGHLHFFTGADWCPDDFTMIVDLPNGREHAAEALRLIALHVLREPA